MLALVSHLQTHALLYDSNKEDNKKYKILWFLLDFFGPANDLR